jgi:outer membrane biosynthesis protein TonB
MKRLLLALIVLGSAHALTAQSKALTAEPQFQAAETVSVTDIPVAVASTANGTVVLDAIITNTGAVERIEVRRDIADLASMAVQTMDNWKFSPATLAGKAIASRMPIAVNFRPPSRLAAAVPLPPLIPQSEAAIQAEFQPAEVIRAAFPNYPGNTVAIGTVVLEVPVSETGKAGEVKVLRDLPPLTEAAMAAVGEWRFMAATLNGHPVRSKIVLAFVFNTDLGPS